ncbi:uncharacterized protein B0H64DRAFT_332420 [Chaetomium fimeti]|uniref:Major facilitator superfamily (MFS) profile domain-containing protein n=1 Tax=Chaetomium fimeti TaxID=1854472 RepID=A0AAE0LMK7_9PEZI|nr:hypothetical protein B0H64DRAFT_332420 [Chaetomium fimeti]
MATSMTAGPLGASMYRSLGWHSVFCLELGFAAIGLVVLHFSFLRLRSRPEHSHSMLLNEGDSKVPRIDLGGWVLLSLAVIVPLIALTLGDNLISWDHPLEISLLICGPILIASFVLFEAKAAAVPIINMTPVFKMEYLVVLFQVFGVISILNSVPNCLSLRPNEVRLANRVNRLSSSSRHTFKSAPLTHPPSRTGP